MAERPEDRRYSRPIVPDPEASLAGHRHRYPDPPRVWPLWLLVLVLVAALGALGWFGWQERQRLQAELTRLGGELSNIHARFDATMGEGDSLEQLEARLDDLTARDQVQAGRFEALREDLEVGLDDLASRQQAQGERLTRIGEAAADREAMLEAFQASLDALERAGDEGRASLAERLDGLVEEHQQDERRLDERLAALEAETGQGQALTRLEEARDELARRLDRHEQAAERERESLQARLDELGETLEAGNAARDDEQERMDALAERMRSLEAELGELRRAQLALSARLEALRP